MSRHLCFRSETGFTLVETLIAAAVSSLVLATVAVGAIALRRTFEAANYHVTAQNDQLRVFDNLGRDVRAASAIAVLDGGRRVDLTLPDPSAGALALRLELPVLGSLHTTSTTPTRTASYYLDGDRLMRLENGQSREIARTITSFRATRSSVGLEVDATFSPRFARSQHTSAQEATRLRSNFLLRNANGG
jgi:type II secretory pathway component PulJ